MISGLDSWFIVMMVLVILTGVAMLYEVNPRHVHHGKATVVKKVFNKAHMELIPRIYETDVLAPQNQTMLIPDKWELVVEVEGRQKRIAVSRMLYKKLRRKGKVMVKYYLGAITGTLYVQDAYVA